MMDEWDILAGVVVAGIGTLAFLKFVGDEVLVKHRVLELRLEVEETQQRHRLKMEQDAKQGVVTQVEGMKSSTPAPTSPGTEADAA